jgi:ALG11 mannosyltransferase N-terminus
MTKYAWWASSTHIGESLFGNLSLALSDAVKSLSSAGGGGERVLWTAIAALQRTDPDVLSVVYSGDIDASKEQIISKVKVNLDYYQRFNCPPLLCLLGEIQYFLGS